MKASDFIYDGIKLSDMGYTICSFNESGENTVSNSSHIEMTTVPVRFGRKNELVSSMYDSYLEATFQICKDDCLNHSAPEISISDERKIMRWLNRQTFHKLSFIDDELSDFYFEAMFNVATITINNVAYGFELTMVTNRPFAVQDYTIAINHTTESTSIDYNGIDIADETTQNNAFYIGISTDDEGILYPKKVEITCGSDGDLDIYNQTAGRHTIIKNCANDEVVTLDYPVITSSYADHAIQNDFNWNYFCFAKAFNIDKNIFTVSMPCTMVITVESAVKFNV